MTCLNVVCTRRVIFCVNHHKMPKCRVVRFTGTVGKYTEDWLSGLKQQFTKLSDCKRSREFESLILRALKIPPLGGYFLARRMSKTPARLTERFERRSHAVRQASRGREHLVDLEPKTNKYT